MPMGTDTMNMSNVRNGIASIEYYPSKRYDSTKAPLVKGAFVLIICYL